MTEIIEMICKSPPYHLFKTNPVSRESKIMVFKMLQRDSSKRPTTHLLLLCPYLISHVAKVYLNLGRAYSTPNQYFGIETFQHYLKKPSN